MKSSSIDVHTPLLVDPQTRSSVPDLLVHRLSVAPHHVAFALLDGHGATKTAPCEITTAEFANDVRAVAKGLMSAGVAVAGACGIVAGTPLAVLAAIARIARSGAFVKDGAHLESLSTIDTIRPTAGEAIAKLHKLGLRTQILTGDQDAAAQAVVNQLSVNEVHSGRLPDQRLAAIDKERAEGYKTAMEWSVTASMMRPHWLTPMSA